MAERRWRRYALELRSLRSLLRHLRLLDHVLDAFLLQAALLAIRPPHGSLVVASKSQVMACFARGFAFLALLPTKPASEATWNMLVSQNALATSHGFNESETYRNEIYGASLQRW